MAKTTRTTPATLSNPWVASVEKLVREKWAKQAFRLQRNHVADMEAIIARRPDYNARISAIASLTDEAAGRAATRGVLTDGEYLRWAQARLFELCPFLGAETRRELANELLALHAAQLKAA
jgi:hypothetical protein